jgi:hypothetical protein
MFTHSIATPSRLPRSARFGISGRIYPPRLRTRLRSVGPKGLSSLTVFVDASPGLVFVGHRSLPERTITKSPNGYWRKPRLFHIRCLNFNTSPNSLSRFVPSIPSGRAISLVGPTLYQHFQDFDFADCKCLAIGSESTSHQAGSTFDKHGDYPARIN